MNIHEMGYEFDLLTLSIDRNQLAHPSAPGNVPTLEVQHVDADAKLTLVPTFA